MKKAEVRRRMEEASQAKRKKGFMTADRKKKLRVSSLIIQLISHSVTELFVLEPTTSQSRGRTQERDGKTGPGEKEDFDRESRQGQES